jgi:hypothetical protein
VEPATRLSAGGGLRPSPAAAPADKGVLWSAGCVLLHHETDSGPCSFGDRHSKTTVVAFGDSHALEWFAPLLQLARERHWRLVGLVRARCVVAAVAYERFCDVWRRKALRRIARRERPAMVVISSATSARYRVVHGGATLSRQASEPVLVAGFARTLRRLKRTGARVVVIRDQPLAPFDPPSCVASHLREPGRCAFAAQRRRSRSFDARGAARVPGVKLIDPLRVLCPHDRCPSVMGDLLVYRNNYHMTATFARTLAPWLGRELPRL